MNIIKDIGVQMLLVAFIPMLFQIFFGSGIVSIHRKMKFWHICIITTVLWLATLFINLKIAINNSTASDSGWNFLIVPMIGIILGAFTVLIIILQILLKFGIRTILSKLKKSTKK